MSEVEVSSVIECVNIVDVSNKQGKHIMRIIFIHILVKINFWFENLADIWSIVS